MDSVIHFPRRAVEALFILLITVGLAGAQTPIPAAGLDVHEFSLRNGMMFLVVERHATPQVACRVAVRAGSAFEDTGNTGIAHLLEHMMFKGTKNFGSTDPVKDQALQARIESVYQDILGEQRKRDPDMQRIREMQDEMMRLRHEVQRIFLPNAFSAQLGRNGAVDVNAFTGKDETQYTASVPSDMIEQWFSIISEQLFEPAWREFYVEREVVQREWAFRYVNNPEGAAWVDLYANAYTAHPYRNPTIGWKSDMDVLSTEAAMRYHGNLYCPSNAVCVLVGDVTVEQARRLAEVYFERYPSGKRSPEAVTREPAQEGWRKSVRFLKGARTPLVRVGFHGARMGEPDFYALDLMTMLLSQGRGAPLTQNIVDKGLAVDAWAANPDNRFGGMVILGGTAVDPRPDKEREVSGEEYIGACEELERLLLEEVERLKTEPVSDRRLDRVKKINRRDYLSGLRSNEALAGTLATLEVQTGWKYMTSYLEEIEKVSAEDVRRVARAYFSARNRTSVYVIPGGDPEKPVEPYSEIRSVSSTEALKSERPASFQNRSIYPTPPGWKHPLEFERTPVKITYPAVEAEPVEGVRVLYLPDRELPLVSMRILIGAGSVDMKDGAAGAADVLSLSLVRGGTEKHSPSDLAMLLDESAARLSVSVNEEQTVIDLFVMKEDWEQGIGLLREVLGSPRLDAQVVEVSKQEALTNLKRQGEAALAVARRESMVWHFKGHPYGRDPMDGLRTIPSISRESLMAFLKTYFVPSNMVIAVSGDIDKAKALDSIGGLVKALPRESPPGRALGDPPASPPVLAAIHKPGQVQSQVLLLLPGVQRTHPRYWKIGLLADILGGGDSLLHTRLREELGLVYAARFHQVYKWKAGILSGYIGCKGDSTAEAVEETVKVMNTLRKGVPEKDFHRKRLDALNSFVFNVDTPAALVQTYAGYCLRGEPMDTLDRIQDAYLNASLEELTGLAEQYLDPKHLQVFVVADTDIRVKGGLGTLASDLRRLAETLGLPYREIELR